MTQNDLARHANLSQRLLLESAGIDFLVAGQMKFHIENRCGEILDGCESLIESFRTVDLVNQRLRNRLTGLIMNGVVRKDARLQCPVLVELRRELDEVPRDVCARQ